MDAANVRQQIVADEVEGVAALLKISEDDAFLRFAHQLLSGRSLHAFDEDSPGSGYDLVCFFGCLHSIGDPIGNAALCSHPKRPIRSALSSHQRGVWSGRSSHYR